MRVVNSPLGIDNPREYCALQPWLLASQKKKNDREYARTHISERFLSVVISSTNSYFALYVPHARIKRIFRNMFNYRISSHFRIVMTPITYVAAASAASELGDRGLAVAAFACRSSHV
jgi:hypothetical protein